MSTIRIISPQYRMARERRREAVGFFRQQEQNPDMPLAARHVAGFIARALEAIYAHTALTGDEKDFIFRTLIQKAQKHGILARV